MDFKDFGGEEEGDFGGGKKGRERIVGRRGRGLRRRRRKGKRKRRRELGEEE